MGVSGEKIARSSRKLSLGWKYCDIKLHRNDWMACLQAKLTVWHSQPVSYISIVSLEHPRAILVSTTDQNRHNLYLNFAFRSKDNGDFKAGEFINIG
jgi:hypothetical protein